MGNARSDARTVALSAMSSTGVYITPYDRFWTRMVARRTGPLGSVVQLLLRLVAVDIPKAVKSGPGLKLLHVGSGHTLHRAVELGADVVLGPGVVLGKKNLRATGTSNMRIVVGDGAIIAAGAVVLAEEDQVLVIGEGAVIGANAVVTESVPSGQVWAGAPARKVGVNRS